MIPQTTQQQQQPMVPQTTQQSAQPLIPVPQTSSQTSPQSSSQSGLDFRGTFQHLPPPISSLEQKFNEIPPVPEPITAEQQSICPTQVFPVGMYMS